METVVVTGEFHESFVFCDFEQILMSSLDENLTQANNRDMSAGKHAVRYGNTNALIERHAFVFLTSTAAF